MNGNISPPAQLLCALILIFAIAITPNGHWLTWLIYGLGLAGLIWLLPVDFFKLMRRLAIESLFMMVALIGMVFREGEGVIWQWGLFKITMTGLMIFGSILCKLILSLVVMNLLTLMLPIPVLLETLSLLKVPPILIAILRSMMRYLDLLTLELITMRRAAISRNLLSSPRRYRLVVGHMIGALFTRTYDRGERIHQAMLSRGYQGLNQPATVLHLSGFDLIALGLTVIFAIAGQVLFYWVS